MKVWKAAVPLLALIWVALRGNPSLAEFGLGLAFGFVSIYPFRNVYSSGVPALRIPAMAFWFAVYLVVFGYEVLRANLGLAYVVLHPSLPIDPRVFRVPLRVETELGVSLIGNSITLTPGTLTLTYEEREHELRVHTIAGPESDIIESMDRLQRIAKRIGV